MKRIAYTSAVLSVAMLILLGCASSQERAQKLYNAGRYEEVVAKYGDEPSAAPVVQQSKEKIAERWYADKRYQAVIDKFPDTHAAMMARADLMKDSAAPDHSALEQPKRGAVFANKEAAATAEYQRLLRIEPQEARVKALRAFVKDPAFEGTSAQEQAKGDID